MSDDEWNFPNTSAHQHCDDLDPCLNFYQLAVIDVNFERIAGQPENTNAAWNVTLNDSVGLVCAAGYTVDTVKVTVDTTNPMSKRGISTSGPLKRVADVLSGFPYGDLTNAPANELLETGLPSLKKGPNTYLSSGSPLLLANLNGRSSTALLNTTALKNTAEEAFKGIVVQLVHNYLRKPDNTKTTVEISYQQQRLQIRLISIWAMGTGFVLLALCAIAVLVWRPKDVVSRNPHSIASQATVLAASSQLQTSLETAGSLAPSLTADRLQGLKAISHIVNRHGISQFYIEVSAGSTRNEGLERRFDRSF